MLRGTWIVLGLTCQAWPENTYLLALDRLDRLDPVLAADLGLLVTLPDLDTARELLLALLRLRPRPPQRLLPIVIRRATHFYLPRGGKRGPVFL